MSFVWYGIVVRFECSAVEYSAVRYGNSVVLVQCNIVSVVECKSECITVE
jgi:hypothetical protein